MSLLRSHQSTGTSSSYCNRIFGYDGSSLLGKFPQVSRKACLHARIPNANSSSNPPEKRHSNGGIISQNPHPTFTMAHESIVEITEDNFEAEVEKSELPILVDVWGEGCGPCKMIEPLIDQVAADFEGKARVGKLNIGENMALAAKFGISGVPTILFFKGGEEVADDRIRGASGDIKNQITTKLEALAS